jgi:hypothetical protein
MLTSEDPPTLTRFIGVLYFSWTSHQSFLRVQYTFGGEEERQTVGLTRHQASVRGPRATAEDSVRMSADRVRHFRRLSRVSSRYAMQRTVHQASR